MKSLERLQGANPKLRAQVGQGVMAAAEADDHWTEQEALLVRAILQRSSCPILWSRVLGIGRPSRRLRGRIEGNCLPESCAAVT